MRVSGYSLSFLLLLEFVCEISLQQCKTGTITSKKNGKMLENYSLDKVTLIGYKQCAEKCFVWSDCVSFNYNKIDRSCELNTANETDVSLSTNGDYIYTDKTDIEPSLAQTCSTVSCPSGYRCVPFRNGQTRCISYLLDKPETCRNTMLGKEYSGTISITAMGITCQQWSSNTPHTHIWHNETANYCRNPDNEMYGPWCYTVDANKRWQYCDVPFCVHKKQKECKTTTLGYEYFGIANTTITGKECQTWELDTPHPHIRNELPRNECRNPDAAPNGPWCYTTDNSTRWEYCDIPFC